MASIFFSALAQALSADVVGVATEQDRSRSVSAALGQLCAYMRLRPPPGTVLDPLAGRCIFCKSVRHASCGEKGRGATHLAANLQVSQIQNGVRTFTSLLSLSFSSVITVINLS